MANRHLLLGIGSIILGALLLVAVVFYFVPGLILGPIFLVLGIFELIKLKLDRVPIKIGAGVVLLPIIAGLQVIFELIHNWQNKIHRIKYPLPPEYSMPHAYPLPPPPSIPPVPFSNFYYNIGPKLIIGLLILDVVFIAVSIWTESRKKT